MRYLHLVRAAGVALACICSAAAQAPYSAVEQRLNRLQHELRMLQVRLNTAKTQAAAVHQRIAAGGAPVGDAVEADGALEEAMLQVTAKEQELATVERDAALLRPVSADLHDSSLRQAATVLTHAAGIPVRLAPDAPADLRVTIQAHDAPLATVLELVASRAELILAPSQDGVTLERYPSLVENGRERTLRPAVDPWSDAWGVRLSEAAASHIYQRDLGTRWEFVLPTDLAAQVDDNLVAGTHPSMRGGETGGVQPASGGAAGAAATRGAARAHVAPIVEAASGRTSGLGNGLQQWLPAPPMPAAAAQPNDSYSLQLSGDRLLIAERATLAGARGLRITIYRVVGDRLVRTSAGFHPLGGATLKH